MRSPAADGPAGYPLLLASSCTAEVVASEAPVGEVCMLLVGTGLLDVGEDAICGVDVSKEVAISNYY